MMDVANFHGSFSSYDVTILVKPIVVTEETLPSLLAQTGSIDYAGMIASEVPMPPEYVDTFKRALDSLKYRIASDVLNVAKDLIKAKKGDIVITSLLRAGTPIGVLIHRTLAELGKRSYHYSISATRKRGSDPSALDYILQRHSPESIVFVDGWTGKGYIAQELQSAICGYNKTRGTNIDPGLSVIADLAGVSQHAASGADYLIPSSMLRATGCGLVSASFTVPENDNSVTPDCCLYYENLRQHDLSNYFVQIVMETIAKRLDSASGRQSDGRAMTRQQRSINRQASSDFVTSMKRRFGISLDNGVKPGICESYRAMLTRNTAMTLLIQNPDTHDLDVKNLLYLAQQKGAPVIHDKSIPYIAAVVLHE